ncbi:MAG: FAD/NAD(P)-binding protein, partial [Alphaproteobacteria bacterium]
MTIKVAIIGSGPSGFYTADSLIKSGEDVEIDIIDRLPTPFGL